jgi:5-methylcytosine-specific restriction endonuclease McrA
MAATISVRAIADHDPPTPARKVGDMLCRLEEANMSTVTALFTLSRASDMDRLGDEIARLSAQVDTAIARLLTLIRKFDDERGWSNGFRSCADWLAWRVGLDIVAARERVRIARALGSLPTLAGALERGDLSYTKVRALTRIATPENEARLLAMGRTNTAEQIGRIIKSRRMLDPAVERREAKRQHESRALNVYRDESGMVVIQGRLDPEGGAAFMQALTAAQDALFQNAPRTLTHVQRNADALTLLAEAALHHELDPGAPGERYQVVLHVDDTVLASPDAVGESTLDGTHASAEASQRLSCDASRTWMRHDSEGNILEVGRRTRTIPPALRRALLHRDQVCRFPGCGLRFVQGHHIQHWAHGGPTTLANLVLLCRRHHRALHEGGYRIAREADGKLTFLRPDGRPLPEAP